jgi:ATP-dependent RNA helicase DeaD
LEHRAEAVRARLERTLESQNLDRELFLIGPLLERFDAAEVAAAALRLAGTEAVAQTAEPAAGRPQPGAGSAAGTGIPSWTRLWVGVGKKDNVRPGDLLGAIVGETGLAADQIGKIEVRELFCLVEMRPEVAELVMKALNGTTLRGRHITARLDRGQGPHRSAPPRGGPTHA